MPGASYTEMGWEIYPQGLEDVLEQVYTAYHPRALLVTENGAAFSEADTLSSEIHDEQRIAYLRDHIQAARAGASAWDSRPGLLRLDLAR